MHIRLGASFKYLIAPVVCALAVLWLPAWPDVVSAAGDIMCGLAPPPNAADYKAAQAREAEQVARDGFVRVCAWNLRRYAPPSPLTAMPQLAPELAFCPIAVGATPFARFANLGGQLESIGDVKSALYRVFRSADGLTVTLFEHDMSADGTEMWRAPKDEPERVNGLPARLIVWQAASGKAVSVLSWREGRRAIELWTDANMARGPQRARLFALAAALPKSVPARADEPGRMPAPQLGPDGIPQMPTTFANAQVQAMVARAAAPAPAPRPAPCC